ITPKKKLSECKTGWALVWSDYDYSVGANDSHWAFSYVPKKFATMSGGAFFPVVNNMNPTRVDLAAKYLYISDTQIKGHADNAEAGNNGNDVCLRYVFEF